MGKILSQNEGQESTQQIIHLSNTSEGNIGLTDSFSTSTELCIVCAGIENFFVFKFSFDFYLFVYFDCA
jgi:hypothetical protein